jgi:hypothetical protein
MGLNIDHRRPFLHHRGHSVSFIRKIPNNGWANGKR